MTTTVTEMLTALRRLYAERIALCERAQWPRRSKLVHDESEISHFRLIMIDKVLVTSEYHDDAGPQGGNYTALLPAPLQAFIEDAYAHRLAELLQAQQELEVWAGWLLDGGDPEYAALHTAATEQILARYAALCKETRDG